MTQLHVRLPTVGHVAFDDAGAGDPIVLLHATLHDRSDWADVTPRLATNHRVIALDWPGHGGSPLPHDGPQPGAGVFAKVLAEFVETLDLRNAVLIGNSVGGYAACRVAITRPDRVAAVVMAQGAGFTPTTAWVRAYCRALARPGMSKRLFPALARAYMRPQSDRDRAIVKRVTAAAKGEAGSATFSAMWRSFAEPDADLREAAGRSRFRRWWCGANAM